MERAAVQAPAAAAVCVDAEVSASCVSNGPSTICVCLHESNAVL